MRFDKCALFCAILALSILNPIVARKSFGSSGSSRHSYPKSGGLSGGGSHGYPSSGGLSGGGSHGYPSSGGVSGGGGHGYPSSGGSHGYPSSGGSHGYPSSGGLSGSGGKGYPSSGGSHGYPSSNSHGYPASGGLSGNNNHGYPKSPSSGTTNVHHHYHYSPPQQIQYSPTRGGPPVSYPVYQGTPPTYVYKYKDSGSKYGTLLTGLALLNLGTLAAGTAYAVSHSHGSNGGSSSSYKPAPGEVCKFGLKKSNGDYEETRIDCQLITSFIFAEQSKTQGAQQHNTTITTVTTVSNVTMFNNTNPAVPAAPVNQTATKTLYEMLPNGTLVPVNVPVDNSTTTAAPDSSANANNPASSVVTTITNTTTVVNALDVKGKPVDVTSDMECFVIRTTPTSRMRKGVPCQLLQTYADKSIKRNSAVKTVPTIALLTTLVALFVLN